MSDTQMKVAPHEDGVSWAVKDSNARRRDTKTGAIMPRTHQALSGREYPLTAQEPTYMPEADARGFLKDEAFWVYDQQGNRVLPLATQALLRDVPKKLDPNMVIADLSELTQEALVTRAAQLPGAPGFTHETPRSRLISFITHAQGKVDGANLATDDTVEGRYLPPEERPPVAEELDRSDAMDDDQVARMLAPAT